MPDIRAAALIGCTLLVSVLSPPLRAAEPPREIEYAYPDQSVWTIRVNAKGELENPLLRLAGALFSRAGMAWHAKPYPAARMFSYLADGSAEFSMLVRAPQLAECCLFSKAPVASTELRVYRLGDTPAVRTKQDLVGKKVIIIRGYSYAGLLPFFSDPANRVSVNATIKHDAAFAMLEAGRGDYVLDYTGPAQEVLADHAIAGIRNDVLSTLDVHLVLNKSFPDAEAVMAKLEAAASGLNKDEIMKGR